MKKLSKQEQKDEALKAYYAKLREIDEKDIKIINGKRYKLIDED